MMLNLKKMFFVLCGIMMFCGHSMVSGEVTFKSVEPFANYVVKRVGKAPLIDGDLSEWGNISPIILVSPKGKTKAEEEDLSAKVYLMYDEDNLYFAAEVRDDIFFQPYRDREMWRGDSIQIAFDPLCDGKSAYTYNELRKVFDKVNGRKRSEKELFTRYNSDDYEYGFALTKDGYQVWQWCPKPEREVNAIDLAMINKGKRLIYEASIPWKEITPFKLKEDIVCGFKVFVLDKDEVEGKRKHLEWTPWDTHIFKDRRTFGNLLFLPTGEMVKLYIRNLTEIMDTDVEGQLSIFSLKGGDSKIEFQIKDKEKVIFAGSKTINIDRGANLVEFAIGTKKLPYGEYNLEVVVYDSNGIKQGEVSADITKVNSDKLFEKFVKLGDYRKSLTDVSKLTKVAFIDVGAKGDEKYLDTKTRIGEPEVKFGQTVRRFVALSTAIFRIPVRKGVRNLIRVRMYREAKRSANGGIYVNGKVGTLFGGKDWYIAECVVENPSENYLDLEVVFDDGNIDIDWIAVYKEGIEKIKRPMRICAWNAPIRNHFVKVAPNGRYFMFDDGSPMYPIGIAGGRTLPGRGPWDSGWFGEDYNQERFEEYVKFIFPYMNLSKRFFSAILQCPSAGKINNKEMRNCSEVINICKKYGLYTAWTTSCHHGLVSPHSFSPDAKEWDHQIWWTKYLARRYSDEVDIILWGVHDESGLLQGNAYQRQLWHRMVARCLKAENKSNLVFADVYGFPPYVGGMNKQQLPMLGNEGTIDSVIVHPYTVTDDAILIGKFAQASCRNKKPVADLEFEPICDTECPFTTTKWDHIYYCSGQYVSPVSDENTTWFDGRLYKVFDLQCGQGWWDGPLHPAELDAITVIRKVVEKVNWVDFDPNPKIAVECIPYDKVFADKDIRKMVLSMSKERGIPFDLVFEWQPPGRYDYIVRSPEDLAKVDRYRDIKCNTWSKYLIDKNGRYALVWVKADKKPKLSIKGLNRGRYLIDWISLKTGDIELTEERAVGRKPLNIAHNQKGNFVVYIHPKTNYTKDYNGFKFIEDGIGTSVLVGPEDVPLGMVYFDKETPLFCYMHLKEIVELLRDRSGVMLSLKTPAELSNENKRNKNILLAGGIKLNPIVKWLKDTGYLDNPLKETNSYILITNPWNAGKRVLIIKGDQEKKVVENIGKIKQAMFSGDQPSGGSDYEKRD